MAAAGLRAVGVTRYVEPLREGGSLPGLVEADDDGLYVAKFRGAGQGTGALVAEVVVGELARALGLPVPELVALALPGELARAEPDPEIQELLAASAGTNLGVDFLPGALPFSPAAIAAIDPSLAADIVWLDALTTNVDRTPRNPNLLVWHGRPWAIDHGAALFRQYGERPLAETRARAVRAHRRARAARRRRPDRPGRRAAGPDRAGRPRSPRSSSCPRIGSARTRPPAGPTSRPSSPSACVARAPSWPRPSGRERDARGGSDGD